MWLQYLTAELEEADNLIPLHIDNAGAVEESLRGVVDSWANKSKSS
jgi:hypothetical protein